MMKQHAVWAATPGTATVCAQYHQCTLAPQPCTVFSIQPRLATYRFCCCFVRISNYTHYSLSLYITTCAGGSKNARRAHFTKAGYTLKGSPVSTHSPLANVSNDTNFTDGLALISKAGGHTIKKMFLLKYVCVCVCVCGERESERGIEGERGRERERVNFSKCYALWDRRGLGYLCLKKFLKN